MMVLPLLFLVAMVGIQALNLYFQKQSVAELSDHLAAQMMAGHRETLKTAVEVEATTLSERLSKITDRAAQIAAIIAETDPLRFAADQSGYFFTYDFQCVRVNVPTNKSGNGQSFLNATDRNGIRYVERMAAAAKNGGGFVDYWFDKPGKGVQPKTSFVKPIRGTEFFVGAGVYTDDVAEEQARVAAVVAARNRRALTILGAIGLGVTAIVLLGSVGVARSITRSVRVVIHDLDASAGELTAASSQVSKSSQTLAAGSSEQAASLEETSASLEEISSMTKRNAASAGQAKELATQTRHAAEAGAASMSEMTQAMDAIKGSSASIAKIVQTIDQIAFQTNILALNAAVEAARAGESGAGFAVVAEEVRNLAQRSAVAAKETAEKIDDSVARSENGVRISGKVASDFGEIVAKARQVDELVAEIATASHEQNQGLGQVSVAVTQMDQVTQSNAASAEETAAASEQLSAQALVMRASVQKLQRVVDGGAEREPDATESASRTPVGATAFRPASAALAHENGSGSSRIAARHSHGGRAGRV